MEKHIHRFYLTSAIIMTATTCLHVFAGTGDVMTPILTADIHPIAAATSYVVWHMVSLILLLNAVALFWLARHENGALLVMLLAMQAGFAAIFIAINVTSFGTLWAMPQWTIFGLVSVLLVPGVLRHQKAQRA